MSSGLLFLSSPLQVEEETCKVIDENQGIVSILRSDQSNMATANSLKRNLSADMSSRKWLAQNGFSSSMKKIASSEQLSEISMVSITEASLKDETGRPGQDDVWMSIQLMKKKEAMKTDTWSSILSQNAKVQDHSSNNLPPPYVHPLVKQSSSLSEKSLQICTESLGSETGSEGFSSYPSSDQTTSDTEEDKDVKKELIQQHKQTSQMEKQSEEWQTTKCMYSTRTKSTPRSFPPPLPSLTQSAGLTLHMQSRRLHGRLVLEAVSVPSQNLFHAQRLDGRLVLKLKANQNLSDEDIDGMVKEQVDEEEIDEQVSEDFQEEEREDQEDELRDEEVEEIVRQETEVKEVTVLMEQEPRLLPSGGPMNVHRSAIMFKKIMRIDNVNPAWPNRFNREVNLARVKVEVELQEEENALLPPVARLIGSPAATTTVGTTAPFNAYDYFWRTKPTNNQQSPSPTEKNNILTILPPDSPKACQGQELVFLRGNKGEYLVPLVTGCKDSRRSLLIWEPYCIATS